MRAFTNAISALTLMLAAGTADDAAAAGSGSDAAEHPANQTQPSEEPAPKQRRSIVDGTYETAENMLQATVRRVDGFFVNDEFTTFGDRKTRVRLRLDTDYVENGGWDVKPRLRLHLVMPGLEKRLRLVVNDNGADDSNEASAGVEDENDVALRWVARQDSKLNLSFDGGLRIKSGTPDPFARINTGKDYKLGGRWHGQTTNRLYYYSKTAWRNDLRQYFNRPIRDHLLFRSRTRIQYFDENSWNPEIEQKFTLFQTLGERSAMAYDLIWRKYAIEESVFDEDEILPPLANRYEQVMLAARYRTSMWRDWFYVEVWPIVAWPEERDWDTTLAVRMRLEVNLGGSGDSRLDD